MYLIYCYIPVGSTINGTLRFIYTSIRNVEVYTCITLLCTYCVWIVEITDDYKAYNGPDLISEPVGTSSCCFFEEQRRQQQ